MATVYFTKPITSDLRADVLQYIRDAINSQARLFEGDTLVSPPTNAIRYVAANNRFEKWTGAVWDPLNITGNVTPTPPGGSTNHVQFNAGGGAFGGSSDLTWDGTNKLLKIANSPALVHLDGVASASVDAPQDITNAKSLAFLPLSGVNGSLVTHRLFQWSATHNRGFALAHNHPVSGSGTGELYFNALQGATWQTWRKLWHDGNFDPATRAVIGSIGTTDFNSVTTAGMYRFEAGNPNGPGFGYGQLLVVRGGLDTIAQVAFNYTGNGIRVRAGNPPSVGGGGSWAGWSDIWTTSNFDPNTKANLASPAFTGTPTIGGSGVMHDWRQSILGGGTYMWDWWRMRNAADNQTLFFQCNSAGSLTISNTPWNLNLMVLDQSGNVTFAANVTAYSDERLKKNFVPFQLSAEDIQQVAAETYDRTDNGQHEIGVRAQSLQRLIPLAVRENEEGILSVDYGRAALVAAVNLAREVADIKAKMEIRP